MNNIEILKLTEGFGGEYLTKEIIKRSKDNNIIYLTEDVLLNTKCVQELAQYLEHLIQENKELKERINKSIEFINNDDTFFDDGESWQNVLHIERILKGE